MRKQVSKSSALLAAALCLAAVSLVSGVSLAPRALAQETVTTAEPGTPAVAPPLPADKYLWLEDTNSPRAMDWVKAEDARSLKVLEADPHYAAFYADALKIAVAPDRLPEPEQRGSEIYN